MKKYWISIVLGVLVIIALTLGGYFYFVGTKEVAEESVVSAYTSPSLLNGLSGGMAIGVIKWFVDKIIAICAAIFMLFLAFCGVMVLLMAFVGV